MSIFKRLTGGSETRKKKNLQEEFKTMLQENMEEAREEYEDKTEELERFLPVIQKAMADYLPDRILDEDDTPEEGEEAVDPELIKNSVCIFHVSEDKMLALGCMLPPVNGGKDMTWETLEKELRYAGLSYGVDQTLIKKLIGEEAYLRPFPVAAGTPYKDGKNGVVVDCFERKACLNIEAADGEVIDFSQEITMQVVQKDAIICQIQPAEKAVDGMDVVGNVLKGTDGVDVEVTAGENTYLSASGKQLLASIDGVISVTEKGDFYVKPQRTVSGSAGRHTGNIYGKGDLYIAGNVNGNIVVKADGDLIIGGEVRDAQITAGGNVRIQKGIVKGPEETTIKAGGQLQAAVIDGVEVEAGGNIYAQVIVESKVTSGESVFANSDRGLIIGGEVKARKNVTAKEIGNISGCANHIFVGYAPERKAELEELKKEQKDSTATLDMLQKNISTLKAVGSHLPPDKKELLTKLEEQRELYEGKEAELAKKIKDLAVAIRKASDGTVSCGKLYPTTEVYIGEKKTVLQRQMEPCRVFISGENIVAR